MKPTDTSSQEGKNFPSSGERLIYVMPEEAIQALSNEEMSLSDFWRILWRGKWLILAVTTLFAVGSVVQTLTATEWYRAEVLLAPADRDSPQALSGTLGGLASLAGLSVGGADTVESLAVLRSRDFAAKFIEDKGLISLFFPEEQENLRNSDGDAVPPDIRDAVKYFSDNIRKVSEDRDTGLVTLEIEWTDPEQAAEWANLLAQRLNEHMRQKALAEAQANVEYLQSELGRTNVVTLQQSIGRLMENELQKLMLARGDAEFAFRVVDQAQIPKMRSRPRRTLTVVLATFSGGAVGVLLVLVLNATRNSKRGVEARRG